MNFDFNKAKEIGKKYFNMMPDKSDEKETIESIENGVSFRGANLWVLVFAIFIASLGLNVNSTAVIIGAMLISPLMGPILGLGLGIGINDMTLLKRSAKNLVVATVISVLTATVYFAISPLSEAQSELLARTSPTLYDVLIAFFGGAAGIVALAAGGKGNVIPGVAIATALMPPLCTAGFGIATLNFSYFIGAFYLFYINSVFICIATYLGVKFLKFSPIASLDSQKARNIHNKIIVIAVVTLIPAAIMTYKLVGDTVFQSRVKNFVDKELDWKGSQVISYDANKESKMLRVVVVGNEVPDSVQRQAKRLLEFYGMKDFRLQLIQGAASANIQLLENKLAKNNETHEKYQQMLMEESARQAKTRDSLHQYRRYEELSNRMRGEIRVLYPSIKSFSLSRAVFVSTDTLPQKRYVAAIVELKKGARMNDAEQKKMRQWIGERAANDSIVLLVMP
ncbi:MAG: DUF389 domain-containing protein [Prevotella sp.]|uniref:DUF389 domain-containing protein n=1 Tax=Prevotella sp. TaxID=59823 RepID=UPI002A331E3F|nr:DUF389 domain-containing protein [Prevotella sp.]MDD7318695.1 DUF389 domain-containing protein [Prevotellaceae bacterium]MDY4019338.1 DUF389 domain-containing protein [Prevotella sp.]